ncbi:MAG: hypothetical protein C0404_08065 [Verrucomicrobia bacterium]|nr:hypothetical protein [Verrucomicrobiota bacterium]
MQKRRIAITGLGPLAATGTGRDDFGKAVLSGRTGVKPVSLFDVSASRAKLAALVENFDVGPYLPSPKTYLDRHSELAFGAMSLALKDSGIDPANFDRSDAGLFFGTAYGNMETARLFFSDFLEKGPRFVKPVLFPHAYSNTTASLLAMDYGLSGYHVNFSSGWVSSALAMLQAYDMIRHGRLNLAFTGGCDIVNQALFAGLDRERRLGTASAVESLRGPYDANRSGFVPGDGAAIVVLEEYGRAVARGAHIAGELAGCSVVNSPGGPTAPASLRAMSSAIAEADLGPGDIDLVVGHASGDKAIDAVELEAISSLAKEAGRTLTAFSIKTIVGETTGAAGALQVCTAAALISAGLIPAIYGLRTPEAAAGVLLPTEPVAGPIRAVLVNSMDPGGSIVSFVIKS